jgi:signal transduction histidine kinase
MSLRKRILLALFAIVVLFLLLDAGAQRFLVWSRFAELERSVALQSLDMARTRIDDEIGRVDGAGRRLAKRIEGGWMPSGRDSLEVWGLELVFVCDESGRVLWQGVQHPTTRAPLRLRDFPQGALAPGNLLLAPEGTRGLWMTERGTLIVSSTSFEGADEAGRRCVIVGRFLNDARWEELVAPLHLETRLLLAEGASTGPERELVEEATMRSEPVLDEDEDLIRAYASLDDVRGFPILVARVEVPREIMARAIRSSADSLLSSVAATILLLLSLAILLQKMVLSPVDRLTEHATSISESVEDTRRLSWDRGDELGVLARELDRMVDDLEKLRRAKVEMARLSGRSEVANGVLHNVGNVLNSVSVSAELAGEKLRKMSLADLGRALDEIENHGNDLASFVTRHPRGRLLLPFLVEWNEMLRQQHEDAEGEVDQVRRGLDHIAAQVRSQQEYAGHSQVKEWCSLDETIEAALELSQNGLADHEDVEIVRDLQPLPDVFLDRHRLLEILVNLILNSSQALVLSDVPSKRLVLRTRLTAPDVLEVAVEDNGIGIPEESLVEIFRSGFTTRSSGQGFGLHMAATTAGEMEGTLEAHSGGPGEGATFTLRLTGVALKQSAAAA